MNGFSKKAGAFVASGALAAGVVSTVPMAAQAEECVGESGRNQITYDTAEVMMDSCQARDLVNAYGDVQDAIGLGGLIGAKYPAASWLAAPFYGWAWNNKAKVRDCEVAHTGVTYTEINGIITSCSPQ